MKSDFAVDKAFTLIEILVAAAVSIVMIGLLGLIAQNVMRNFQATQEDLIARRDAELALDVMIPDLEAVLVPRAAGSEGLRSTVELVNGLPMAWLACITTATDSDVSLVPGLARAISYRVAYQDVIIQGGPRRSFALYRATATAAETRDNAFGKADLQKDFWQASGRKTTDLGDFLVGNVTEFRVQFLPSGSNQWQTLQQVGDQLTISRSGASAVVDGALISLPEGIGALEVQITVLSGRGRLLLEDGAVSAAQASERYGRRFSRRTTIFAAPPR